MAKDEAVRNQKVFVRLDGVLNLQLDYAQAVVAYGVERNKDKQDSSLRDFYRGRVVTYEEVIKTLQLPVSVKPID
jgi:hypothetical protein